MMFTNFLDPILNPLLALGAFWAILIISIFVAVFTTVVYKYTTDQTKLRKIKADLKEYQSKAKEHSKSGNNDKAMKLQKDMMKLNGQYMKASMKSTLYTFLPLIIFFGWLGAHLAFAPLLPMTDFTIQTTVETGTTGNFVLNVPSNLTVEGNLIQPAASEIVWKVKGPAGTYDLSISHPDSGEEEFFTVLITDEPFYENPLHVYKDSEVFNAITIGNKKLLIFEGIPLLGQIPWINTFGWFGAYFLFSIIFSTSLRKIMKLA